MKSINTKHLFWVISVFAVIALALVLPKLTKPGHEQLGTSSGGGLVGGQFSLLDHTGKRVTQKDFLGKYLLVYFGYTYCPEICPTTLQSISDAMDLLGPKASDVTPLFITIDPERDNAQQLAEYVSNFHDRTVGLTGSAEEIRTATKAYRVYTKKVVSEDAIDFDHSSITFLMDRKGKYISHFAYGIQGDVIAKKILSIYKAVDYQKISKAE